MLHILLITTLLFSSSTASKSKDKKDVVVPCVFKSMKTCYQYIGNLGANLTVDFARTEKELNDTCSPKTKGVFNNCIGHVQGNCSVNEPKISAAIQGVQKLVSDLCTNGSATQKTFLNSTKCFNQNLQRSQSCYWKYATNKTDDAKALCCSVYNTEKCLKKKLQGLCSGNSTVLRERLLVTFDGYANATCAKYYKHCNGATSLIPMNTWALGLTFLTLLSSYRKKL